MAGSSSRRCCSPCFVIILIIIVCAGGGVLLWQFLPNGTKQSVQDKINNISGKSNSTNTGGGGNSTNSSTTNSTTNPSLNATGVFNQCSDQSNCCNGLSTICDLRADQILYATLHNAMATSEDGFTLGPNHFYSLEKALAAGYRGINVDLGICNGEMKLVHGICALGTLDPTTVFTNINNFLNENPNEVIIMPIEVNTETGGNVSFQEFYNLLAAVGNFTNRLYAHTPGDQWPTLRTMIDSDQRVLMFFYNNGSTCRQVGCPAGFHDWFDYAAETQYNFGNLAAVSNVSYSCEITRGGSGTRDFFGVNAFVTLPNSNTAAKINAKSFIQPHISDCSSFNNGLDVNLVLIDFWSEGDLVEVMQSHNNALGQLSNSTARRSLLRQRSSK